jgi:hypothetical protein
MNFRKASNNIIGCNAENLLDRNPGGRITPPAQVALN